MSIQRWDESWYGEDYGGMKRSEAGFYVLYSDHVAAMEWMEKIRRQQLSEQKDMLLHWGAKREDIDKAVEAEGKSWQETVENLLDRAEKAEAEVVRLKARVSDARSQVNDLKARLIQANERAKAAFNEGRLAQSAVEVDASVIRQNRSYDKGVERERDRIRQAVGDSMCDCDQPAHKDWCVVSRILSIIDGGE